MAGLYTATWVSDEKAGAGGGPNAIRFWCDTNAHALQVAGNLDNLISGDLMSVTNDMDFNYVQSSYPAGTSNVESYLLIAEGDPVTYAGAGSEHGKSFDVADGGSVISGLNAYVAANAGKLRTFTNNLIITKVRGVSH